MIAGPSDLVMRFRLMARALARSDAELFGNRHRYERVRFECAARLIAGESTWSAEAPSPVHAESACAT